MATEKDAGAKPRNIGEIKPDYAATMARELLFCAKMSANDAIKTSPTPLPKPDASILRRKIEPGFDPARHVAPVVAHELNNILTIVQGYADRLLLRHGEDPDLMPQLKLISEASRRAAAVIRRATPPRADTVFRNTSPPVQATA